MQILQTASEMESYFQNTFVQFYQTAKNKLFAPILKFIKPHVAAVDVKWEITGRTDVDETTLPSMNGIMVWTMTKEKGQWLIKVMHNVSLPG